MRRLEEMKNWSYKEAYEFALDVENRSRKNIDITIIQRIIIIMNII